MRMNRPATASLDVRLPAVAGRFYEGRPDRLVAAVDGYLAQARASGRAAAPTGAGALRAIVVPHAGHIYSGPTAAFAFAALDPAEVERVVLLGPAHYVPVDGIGTTSARRWRTPLGDVPLDGDLAEDLTARVRSVHLADVAHGPEHSLEVQVPFLQRVLTGRWLLLPLLVGADLPEDVADLIRQCAALPRTLIVVSTDLSHYLSYDEAVERDARTIRGILARDADAIGSWDACGRHPLRGLLTAARGLGWDVHLLDARNSGDTAGDRDRVVGYAAFALTEAAVAGGAEGRAGGGAAVDGAVAGAEAAGAGAEGAAAGADAGRGGVSPAHRAALLALARRTIEDALANGGRRPRIDPHAWDRALLAPGAAFVTLRTSSGELLGCIGSLAPTRSLVSDVADHAYDAAFRDPRFPPMTAERARDMVIDISVLGPTRPFPASGYDDLVARVPVGSGVVVSAGHQRGTFLPAVWEQLPEPAAFVAALWRKAGLAPREWRSGTAVEVYETEEFAENG